MYQLQLKTNEFIFTSKTTSRAEDQTITIRALHPKRHFSEVLIFQTFHGSFKYKSAMTREFITLLARNNLLLANPPLDTLIRRPNIIGFC